jgi:hypothetical protein
MGVDPRLSVPPEGRIRLPRMVDIGVAALKETLQEMQYFLQVLQNYKHALQQDATG